MSRVEKSTNLVQRPKYLADAAMEVETQCLVDDDRIACFWPRPENVPGARHSQQLAVDLARRPNARVQRASEINVRMVVLI
jgi:hypothetical protein